MRFPRKSKSSSKLGFIFGIAASIAIFIFIHGIFIVGHELVDEAGPENTIAYLLDRKLESVESAVSRLRGKQLFIKAKAQQASERIEELEHTMLKAEIHTGALLSTSNQLMEDAVSTLEESVLALEVYAKTTTTDLAMFTLSLFVESIAEDISRRLKNAEEHVSQIQADESVKKIDDLIQRSIAITKQFDVEKSVAITIRTDVQKEITSRREKEEPVQECSARNESCTTNADCCSDAGLTCAQVIISNGTRAKRCMVL